MNSHKLKPHTVFGLIVLAIPLSLAHATALPLSQTPLQINKSVPAKPADVAYNEGIEALNRKDWPAAKTAFSNSLQHDPKHVDAMLGLAHVAAQQDKLKEAEEWLNKALSANPQSAAAQLSWGRYLIAAKRYSEAETALKKAASLDPKAFAPSLTLGDLYSGWLNNPKAAADAYRQVTLINPEHAGAHYGLGMSLLMIGQYADAESALRKAMSLTSVKDNPLPQLSLGRVFLAQGKHDDAIKVFSEVLGIHKNLPAALIGRGDGYLAKADFQAASTDYQSAAAAAPKNTEAQLKLGMALQAQQKTADAEKSYLAATRIDPRLAVAYNNLAWMAAENKSRAGQAVEWAKKAVSLVPDSVDFLDTLGWSLRQAGKLDDARVTLEKARNMRPPSASVHYHLGVVYADMGKKQEAKAALQKALAIDKNYAPAQQALKKLDGSY